MTTLNYNKLKLLSITLFLIYSFKFPILLELYKEHLIYSYSKRQFFLIEILSKSYLKKNIFKKSTLYKFIHYYLCKNTSKFIHNLIFK